jgi:hypothetical protein
MPDARIQGQEFLEIIPNTKGHPHTGGITTAR